MLRGGEGGEGRRGDLAPPPRLQTDPHDDACAEKQAAILPCFSALGAAAAALRPAPCYWLALLQGCVCREGQEGGLLSRCCCSRCLSTRIGGRTARGGAGGGRGSGLLRLSAVATFSVRACLVARLRSATAGEEVATQRKGSPVKALGSPCKMSSGSN